MWQGLSLTGGETVTLNGLGERDLCRREQSRGGASVQAPKSPSEVQFQEIYSSGKPFGANFSNQPHDSKAMKAFAA